VLLLSWLSFLGDFRLYAPVAVLYYAVAAVRGRVSVFSATMLASVLLELPTGVLSDWMGRRRTLVAGSALATASIALYAAAPGIGLLMLGAVLEGASRAFFSGNNNALLFDSLRGEAKEARFHEYLGRVGSYCQLALAVSAVLGSLVAVWSFRLVMAMSVAPQAAATILGLFVREPARAAAESGPGPFAIFARAVRRFFSNPRIVRVGGANMLNAVGEACFGSRARSSPRCGPCGPSASAGPSPISAPSRAFASRGVSSTGSRSFRCSSRHGSTAGQPPSSRPGSPRWPLP
jgi:MFS family permease